MTASILTQQQGSLYKSVKTKILTDAEATKTNILEGLDWLDRQTTRNDVAVVFLAGHGVTDKNGMYYFLPVNAKLDHLRRSGLAFSDINNAVASLAGKTLLFADTCHAGNVFGKRRGAVDFNAVVNELTSAGNGWSCSHLRPANKTRWKMLPGEMAHLRKLWSRV